MSSGDVNLKTSSSSDKNMKIISVLSFVFFIALLITVTGLWYQNNEDQRKNSDLAMTGALEEGSVLGASTEDPEALINLAQNLKDNGFLLFGFNGESKTKKQLDAFGQAYSILDYVECDSKSNHSNAYECIARGIEKYPTWAKGDKLFPGYKSPTELEKMLGAL